MRIINCVYSGNTVLKNIRFLGFHGLWQVLQTRVFCILKKAYCLQHIFRTVTLQRSSLISSEFLPFGSNDVSIIIKWSHGQLICIKLFFEVIVFLLQQNVLPPPSSPKKEKKSSQKFLNATAYFRTEYWDIFFSVNFFFMSFKSFT